MIFDIETGGRTPIRMEPAALQYYGGGPGFQWSEDGRRASIVLTDRGYTWRELREVDAVTGAVRVVVRETGDPYFSSYTTPRPQLLGDGAEVLWASERDGWMHLYLYDGQTGGLKNQVTSGEWVFRGIEHVDEADRVLYFTAGGRESDRDPYLEHLYRVNLDGSGLRLLTPEAANHSIRFSPDADYFVDTYSRADLAPVSVLRRSSDGRKIRDLEEANIDSLLALGWNQPEPFQAKARDGVTDIYGLIWRPTTFDPARRYPVVEQIYTGPHSFFVPKSFSAYRNTAQSIAELGFIVVQIDGLGTSGRSREFHDFSYRNLGDGGIPDHVAAMRQMASRYPYMDLDRVGIYGHSAGGYDATHAILAHPEFYKVAVSSAGNHDHRLDKAVWNTQWMGLPIDEHYEEQSNVTLAGQLQGKLLLVHGDVDENVPVSATLRLVDALIKAEKDFEMLIMPNQTHGLGRHPYFTRKRWDFFVKHLHGVDPPADYRIGENVTTSPAN
jgi:dipeptidyl aminopeptidase/acylaminoacyl peptidase